MELDLRRWEGMMAPGIDEEMNEDRDVRTGHSGWGMMRALINFDIFFRESHVLELPFLRLWIPDFELWRNC